MNCELIKFVEATPDTVLTMISDEKLMVTESVDEILKSTKLYKAEVLRFPEKIKS